MLQCDDIKQQGKSFMKTFVLPCILYYIGWTLVYISVGKMHSNWCLPTHWNVMDIVSTPIKATFPHCKALLWGMNTSASMFDRMIITITTWGSTRVIQMAIPDTSNK